MIGIISKYQTDILTKDALGNSSLIQKPNQPYIVDLFTLKKIFLQGLPLEIENMGDSTINDVKTLNRNLPLYHFGSAEDIVKFNISWFAETDELEDVITKCKWLFSLTRRDGYDGKFHPVKLFFGKLYNDSTFILTAAPYSIRLFTRDKSMLPRLATQELTFKRISEDNPTFEKMQKFTY